MLLSQDRPRKRLGLKTSLCRHLRTDRDSDHDTTLNGCLLNVMVNAHKGYYRRDPDLPS